MNLKETCADDVKKMLIVSSKEGSFAKTRQTSPSPQESSTSKKNGR